MNLDEIIFKFINKDLSHSVFDLFFPIWTDIQKQPFFLYIILPVFLFYLIQKGKWRTLRILILTTLVIFFTDNLNHFLIKPIFKRERPEAFVLRIKNQSQSSFPSSHAADAFAAAVFLSLFYPRKKWIFLTLAVISGVARIYCGVHWPSDILVGAIIGSILGILFYRTTRIKKINWLFFFIFIIFTYPSFAKDPTNGKPLFPWIWEDQLIPTIYSSVDSTGLKILGTGAVSTLAINFYDHKIYDYNQDHPILFGKEDASNIGKLGNGTLGIGIAVTQFVLDQNNGLKHLRGLILGSVSHITLSYIFQRPRPNNQSDFLPYDSSFPSGHTTSAFVTAGSLAYAYGWKGGLPAYLIAGAISISRIREERHWASDIISGVVLGSFWARASYNVKDLDETSFHFAPVPVFDGMMISATKNF